MFPLDLCAPSPVERADFLFCAGPCISSPLFPCWVRPRCSYASFRRRHQVPSRRSAVDLGESPSSLSSRTSGTPFISVFLFRRLWRLRRRSVTFFCWAHSLQFSKPMLFSCDRRSNFFDKNLDIRGPISSRKIARSPDFFLSMKPWMEESFPNRRSKKPLAMARPYPPSPSFRDLIKCGRARRLFFARNNMFLAGIGQDSPSSLPNERTIADYFLFWNK